MSLYSHYYLIGGGAQPAVGQEKLYSELNILSSDLSDFCSFTDFVDSYDCMC